MAYKSVDIRNKRNKERYHKYKEFEPFRHKWMYIKGKANQKNLPFDITPDYLEKIWTGSCAISKLPIELYNERSEENHAELDRTIPEKGYVKSNVAWLSRKYNRMKSDNTIEDLKLILNYLDQLKKEYA